MSKLITVFGSPGSGKTTTALALAGRLALLKNNVILMSTDKIIPHLPILIPGAKLDKSHSMGSLLMQSELTQKSVTPKLVLHPSSDCLACMGFSVGDNPIAYPALFDPNKIKGLFDVLMGLVDYVIVDGMSNPVTDSITLAALELSGQIICTLTPDRKGIEYISAMLAVLREEKYKTSKHMRVLSPVRDVHPVKQLREKIEDIAMILPYSPEVEERLLSGHLMRGFGRRSGLVFESRINQIWEALR